MEEIKLEYLIMSLPYELQHKIFHYSILHPTAKVIKELIKETDELNNIHFCIDNLKYDKLSFFEYLVEMRYLKGYHDFEDLIELLYYY
tara:strand:+ start:4957 stop:5220 length:264 start_codon:yes stop_codon:yes gene_type:complete